MWWQGTFLAGYGAGSYMMVDNRYRNVGVVSVGNGFSVDLHDMVITPQNTAVVIVYVPVARDLTAFGGPVNGTVLELVLQEIDIPTGGVLFEWNSLDHVSPGASLITAPTTSGSNWDYLHVNAIDEDSDGNFIDLGPAHLAALQDQPHDRRPDVDAGPGRRASPRTSLPTTGSTGSTTAGIAPTAPAASSTTARARPDRDLLPRAVVPTQPVEHDRDPTAGRRCQQRGRRTTARVTSRSSPEGPTTTSSVGAGSAG